MYNFTLSIPTKMHFGKGQVSMLAGDILPYTKRVLMVYGGGSIKKNGAYDDVCRVLRENGIEWVELGGVASNPRIESVYEGIRLCRDRGWALICPDEKRPLCRIVAERADAEFAGELCDFCEKALREHAGHMVAGQ